MLQIWQGQLNQGRLAVGKRRSKLQAQPLRLVLFSRNLFQQTLDEILGLGNDADLVIGKLGVFGDIVDGILESADLVDQAEVERLFAGVNPSAGEIIDR